jgi:hypothetical protein
MAAVPSSASDAWQERPEWAVLQSIGALPGEVVQQL